MSSLVAVTPQNTLFNSHAGLLGTRRSELPIGGKIRPGIKVLTPKARRDTRALKIYEAGVQAGKEFDTIEAEVRTAVPGIGGVLMPTNLPYFTVWDRDFSMPEVTRLLLLKYGEDRGDGAGHQLYRFPVIFPADDPDLILPHAMRCWGSSQLKYWSEYAADGTLMCKQYVPIAVVGGKRETKLFGGRKTMPRPENQGVCDPEKCREYQKEECKLNGSVRFFIPGIPSIHAFELPTTSWYSLSAIRETLMNVARSRNGRVSGYLHGAHTFWIAKRLKLVPRITEEGKVVRDPQWLIVLEGDVDMGALLLEHSDAHGRLERADATAAALSEGLVIDGEAALVGGTDSPGAPRSASPAADDAGPSLAEEDDATAIKRLRAEIHEALGPLAVPVAAFKVFMVSETQDAQWSVNRAALEKAKLLVTTEGNGADLVGRITNAMRFEVQERLLSLQVPVDVFTLYIAKRVHEERWDTQLPHLVKSLEVIDEYQGKAKELIDLMNTELDLV